MLIKIKKLNEQAIIPTYGSHGAACFDIYSIQESLLYPKHQEILSTGLAFEIPNNYMMMLFGRSGHGAKGLRLANCTGIIDSDYRGELKVMLRNDGVENITIKPGDRIAQAMLFPCFKVDFKEVRELSETIRGSGGLGSTGK